MSESESADTADAVADTADTASTDSGQAQGDTDKVIDWEAEAIKWRALARKHEKTAKSASQLQRELDATRQSSMTEQERAVETARSEARAEALKSAGERLARAEVKAALSSLVDDPAPLMDDLNMSKFVTEDGDVDEEAVESLKARLTAVLGKRAASAGSRAGHGRTGSGSKEESIADQWAAAISPSLNR